MVQQIKLKNGRIQEFPDDATLDEINEVLGQAPLAAAPERKGMVEEAMENPNARAIMEATGGGSSPFSQLRNMASGLGEAGQNLGDIPLRIGNMMAGKGNTAPHLDIAEQFGAGNAPSDKFQQFLGKYGIPTAAIGALGGIPLGAAGADLAETGAMGKIAANVMSQGTPQAAYMATQNPENPGIGALEGYAGQALGEVAPYAIKGAKAAYDFLRPGVKSEKFLQQLSGHTAEKNLEKLAETVQSSYKEKKADALQHKESVIKEAGKTDIHAEEPNKLPEGNLDKIAKKINPRVQLLDEKESNLLSKALKSYRKNGDINEFISKGEDVLHVKDPLPESKIDEIDEMLSVPTRKESEYLADSEALEYINKDSAMRKVQSAFEKKSTVSNAVKLRTNIGEEIGNLKELDAKGMLQDDGRNKLKALKRAYGNISKEVEGKLKSSHPELLEEWKTYNQKWRENVRPYESETNLSRMAKGQTKGFTPANARGIFAFPTKEVEKVLSDLPEKGRDYVLYNELAHLKPRDAESLYERLEELKQHKGYANLVTPQMEKLMKSLRGGVIGKRVMGGIGGALAGSPFGLGGSIAGGALGGLGKLGYKEIAKLLKK